MKRLADRIWFSLCLIVLNLAVGLTLYTVIVGPSTVAATPPDSVVSREMAMHPDVIRAIKGTPVRIVIPSLAIDLPVGVGSYNPNDGSWSIDASKPYYADTSVPINDSNGQTLIYGHNQSQVFAALVTIPPGAQAEVYTDNGYAFHYAYSSMTKVIPTDMSVFKTNGPPTLVLQTCAGPWDAYRALYSFKLESVKKV